MEKYDYSKLLGRMKEMHETQASLAKKVGISAASLNLRLGNTLNFKQDDMLKIADALEIAPDDIPAYFFVHQL